MFVLGLCIRKELLNIHEASLAVDLVVLVGPILACRLAEWRLSVACIAVGSGLVVGTYFS